MLIVLPDPKLINLLRLGSLLTSNFKKPDPLTLFMPLPTIMLIIWLIIQLQPFIIQLQPFIIRRFWRLLRLLTYPALTAVLFTLILTIFSLHLFTWLIIFIILLERPQFL
jgi:hypothetical protein